MSWTLEEQVGEELDTLYHGALFLAAGDAGAAEALLVDTVTLAYHEWDDPEEGPARALEARLARQFVAGAARGPRELPGASGVRPDRWLDQIGPVALFTAAHRVPAWPRAALWLVLFRRWAYGDAATALGIDVDTLIDLLGYRDVLMREVLRSSRRGDGTNGATT